MIRLIKAEIAKVWHNKLFLGLLCILLLINLLLLWLVNDPLRGAYAASAYQTMNQNLQDLSMQEKHSFINEETRRITALSTIDRVLRGEAYNGGTVNTAARVNAAAEFDEFYEQYESGQFLVYCDTIAKELLFLQKIQAECNVVSEYDAFLDGIATKASGLSSISIFAESANGYDMANINATAAAYEDMRGIVIDYTPQMGIFTALDFALTDFIAVFAMLLIAVVLVRTERDSGMLTLIRATPAGRMKTAVAKLVSLAVGLAGILLLLYGVNLAFCGFMYGLGDFSRSIQSVPALMRSTLKINVGQYLALFLCTKWAAAVVAGLWVMFAMLAANHIFTGILAALLVPGFNLFIRFIVPATSRLNVLKYANLASLLRTNELIGGYRNLYWFGSPVSIVWVETITAVLLLLFFMSLFLHTFTHAKLIGAKGGSLPRFGFRLPAWAASVQMVEAHKLLLVNGALLITVLFFAYQSYTAATTQSYEDAQEIYYSYYMKQVQGPVTREKIEWLKQEWDTFAPLREQNAALARGDITENEYLATISNYAIPQEQYRILENVVNQLYYIQTHPRAQFVYEKGYYKLFDLANKTDQMDTLIACLITTLCFGGLFSLEKQSGMEKVIAATPLGRKATVKAKLRCADVWCVLLTACNILPRVGVVLRDYGLGAFSAPAYSMEAYDGMVEIPLFFLLILALGARYIALNLTAKVTLLLSYHTGNQFAASFAGAGLFCLPLLLSMSGFTAAKWVSAYALFHIAAMLTTPLKTAFSLCMLCGSCFCIWGCRHILCSRFGATYRHSVRA